MVLIVQRTGSKSRYCRGGCQNGPVGVELAGVADHHFRPDAAAATVAHPPSSAAKSEDLIAEAARDA